MEKVRERLRKRPIVSVLVAAGVALVVGGLIGVAGTSSEKNELKKEKIELEARLDQAQENASEAEGKPSKLEEERVETVRRRSRLAEEEKELERRGQLSHEEHKANQTDELETISDGLWKRGTDFVPGTYRAPGGPSCYWATLNSANTEDISNSAFGASNPTVTIESPWFQTEDCGEWGKIG